MIIDKEQRSKKYGEVKDRGDEGWSNLHSFLPCEVWKIRYPM